MSRWNTIEALGFHSVYITLLGSSQAPGALAPEPETRRRWTVYNIGPRCRSAISGSDEGYVATGKCFNSPVVGCTKFSPKR
jgi:hypothetical protein